MQIFTGLMRDGAETVSQGSAAANEIRSSHASIVAAIIAGDTALAQHRMRRHLASTIAAHYHVEALAQPAQA